MTRMILISGGTGFVSRALVRRLNELGQPIRILMKPSDQSPRLPLGIAVEVTVCSLSDPRGLRVAMKGVDTVFHLASSEGAGNRADLMKVDIQGTENIAGAARDVGVDRFFYLSHLGADRASAYPVLKAKAIAYTQLRPGLHDLSDRPAFWDRRPFHDQPGEIAARTAVHLLSAGQRRKPGTTIVGGGPDHVHAMVDGR
jgi:uncharacterized protein YbjT (DUF2867 family)